MNYILAVTGASGSIYAKRFIEKVHTLNSTPNREVELSVIFTQTAKEVFEAEIGVSVESFLNDIIKESKGAISLIDNTNFHFKYSSGSNRLDGMVILPCSMGSLARVAHGLSFDLIGRVADVQLKERRKLVICPRETPLSLIHLKNMVQVTEAGAIIAPANPSFYSNANSINDVVDSFVERVMDLVGISPISNRYKW